jgi:hypothetical protein
MRNPVVKYPEGLVQGRKIEDQGRKMITAALIIKYFKFQA